MGLAPEQLLGVILCGGYSSRFGSDKARAVVDRQPLICAVAAALAPWCSRIIAVAEIADTYADLGLTTIADYSPHLGPVGGINTALGDGHEPWLLVAPCDLVRPRPSWFATLVATAASGTQAAAIHEERWQPLPCLLNRQACADLSLSEGGSLHGVLDRLVATRLARPSVWPTQLSANTRTDLDKLLA